MTYTIWFRIVDWRTSPEGLLRRARNRAGSYCIERIAAPVTSTRSRHAGHAALPQTTSIWTATRTRTGDVALSRASRCCTGIPRATGRPSEEPEPKGHH